MQGCVRKDTTALVLRSKKPQMSLSAAKTCRVCFKSSLFTSIYMHLLLSYRLVMGDINVHDVEGMTPLHCAAHLGRARHIALLNAG